MGYVLKRIEDGKFVSRPGSKSSYTRNVLNARVYHTESEANNDRCGNEMVVNVDALISGSY